MINNDIFKLKKDDLFREPNSHINLLENIRFYKEEEKNDLNFTKHLASLVDLFVNDAFSCSHRNHASVSRITEFLPSYAGLQLETEVNALKKVTSEIKKPITCIIGGSKISTKIGIIKNLIPKFDNIIIVGATGNNLDNVNLKIPLGSLTCVTGVSGSGKSTLILQTLYNALNLTLNNNKSRKIPKPFKNFKGIEQIDKVIDIDQSPIGRTPRSNPATYTGAFGPIRDWFTSLPESKSRGYKPGRFSFNVKGGRCEACEGDGVITYEMHFLPDVYIQCDECKGTRYNRETLEIKFKDKSIADVLDMTVDEGCEYFENISNIKTKLLTLKKVGLGYIKIGQQATTLSGGEAQRIKLAKELSKRSTGRTMYILDEPTTGLHQHDIKKLLEILQTFVSLGNTVVVIEHNLDVIKTADYIVDMGPDGGVKGGKIIAEGKPEEICEIKDSYTGKFLKPLLN